MRLLILSFYYQPDLSAGSFRTTALVAALRRAVPPGSRIDVVTTLPNRYHGYTAPAELREEAEDLTVQRFALPAHRSDVRGQAAAFISFARQVWRHVATREYDLVFATSSRLMTATLGSAIARKKRVPLYLDIRDIFVDTITDLLPRPVAVPLKPFLRVVESWTMRRAKRINLVSRGFEEYFRRLRPDDPFSWFTNGIDDVFVEAGSTPGAALPVTPGHPVEILYAGNMGAGQGLHEIVPALARALAGRANITLIGDGGRRDALASAVAGMANVQLLPPMPRAQLLERYRAAHVLFLHLAGNRAFEKVLPSKLFEYAALGKPVLAGLAGFPARFVRDEIINAAVFAPADAAGAVAAFDSLRIADTPRPDFITRFSRATIAREMAGDVIGVAMPECG